MDVAESESRATPEYPNHLAGTCPEHTRYPRRAGTLLALVLLCLALRTAMVWRIPAVNPDSVVYIQAARALETGDLKKATQETGVNLYPLVLMLLHRAGLDWEFAGMAWGVFISSLVVLPMFGWIRRQFDDRVALAACLLYAFQPKLIEWSPEIMRDATFWFLLMLTVYLLWRAMVEVGLVWFVAAGISMVAACLTRFEGFFLAIPLLLWGFWRWLALTQSRGRLALGLVLCVGAIPAIALAASLVWLSGTHGGVLPRLDPWHHFKVWMNVMTGHAGHASVEGNPLVPASEAPLSASRMLWVFIPTMTRGLSPAYALLMFGGLWGWRRVWSRRDHQALFCMAIAVLVGIWVHLWYDRGICPRYALSIVLLASPFAALGLLGLVDCAARWTTRVQGHSVVRAALVASPVLVVAALGVGDAMTANRSYLASRKLAADLGRWLRQSGWSSPMLVGPVGLTPIVGFYADKGRCELYRMDTADEATVAGLVQTYHPDLLLIRTTKRIDLAQCESLAERMQQRGFDRVDPVDRPKWSEPLTVLVNRRSMSATAYSAHR